MLLKVADKHFLFPYPSNSPDVREGFTGNLEEGKKKKKVKANFYLEK